MSRVVPHGPIQGPIKHDKWKPRKQSNATKTTKHGQIPVSTKVRSQKQEQKPIPQRPLQNRVSTKAKSRNLDCQVNTKHRSNDRRMQEPAESAKSKSKPKQSKSAANRDRIGPSTKTNAQKHKIRVNYSHEGSHGRARTAAKPQSQKPDTHFNRLWALNCSRAWSSTKTQSEKQDIAVLIKEISNDDDEDDDQNYPQGFQLAVIILALCLAVFCVALDNTIIATAIPRITDQFQSIEDVGWYGSSYLLTTCALQLTFGKLYTFYSIKWVFMAALLTFEVGSVLCGAAPNSTTLIIGRAVAGIGSAGLFSGAILIVANTIPLSKRASYTSLIVSMYGISSVAGPLMGGALTDHVSWRWCFYINLPCGAVTATFLVFFLESSKAAKPLKGDFWTKVNSLDPYDLITFIPSIVSLLLALKWGGTRYDWGNGRMTVLLETSGVLMIGFVGLQIIRGESATIPPRVIKNRNVWGSAWVSFSLGGSFFLLLYYLPIWFQAIKGASATKSGIMLLPMNLSQTIVALLAGVSVTRWGYYTPFMYGAVLFAPLGAGLLTTFRTDTGHSEWMGYQVIYGIGIGMGLQQPLVAVQNSVPDPDIPIATAIIVFAQSCGGAIFISVGQNIYQNQLVKNLAAAAPGLDPALVLNIGATDLRDLISKQFPESLSDVLSAYSQALTTTWYVAVALSAAAALGAVFVQWKSIKQKNNAKTDV